MTRVLVVDDEREMCELLVEELGARKLDVASATGADAAFARLSEEDFDVVVTDLKMRGTSGIELCDRIVTNRPDVPVIAVTAFGSMETAVATMRAGAFDFLTKPFDMEQLALSVERAAHHRALREEVKRLRQAATARARFEELIGDSPVMDAVYDVVDRIADVDATVLVTGETGTGKELIARAIHRRGRRGGAQMVTINCAAMPERLLESELFGHVRGAFTDARADKKGLFQHAHRGTMFLDEIGEMPLEVQAKLLRALETRTARPVGGAEEVPFDARLIVATNRDLAAAVEEGRLREDLYYRINVVHIEVPPLRARGADALLLAQAFVEQFAEQYRKSVRSISSGVAERFLAYAWPGNVRELRNCVERAVALTRYEELVVEDLPGHVRDYRPSSHVLVAAYDPQDLAPLAEMERRYILRVLEAVAGNKRQAARILGLDRTTLYRKLARYGVEGS